MTLRRQALVVGVLAWLAAAGGTRAQEAVSEPDYPRGSISGVVFSDLYYNVEGDPEHRYSSSGADSALTVIDGSATSGGTPRNIGQDLNGLLIRRIYLQGDNDLSAKIATRWRLEADSKELSTPGLKISTFVKNAYVQVKNLVRDGDAFFGLISTPVWETSEELWGYRSIEKTITDFRGLGSATDLGVKLTGYVDAARRIGYAGMIGTGTGQRPENNRYKRFYLAAPIRPLKGVTLEPYVDHEDFPGPAERSTYKATLGYELRRITLGAEVVDQVRHTDSTTAEPFGISVFARGTMGGTLSAFARFDRWQPDTRAANRIDSDLYIAGLDWEPHEDVHLMPNVVATQYHARGTAVAPPHHDLQARITVYYRWSGP